MIPPPVRRWFGAALAVFAPVAIVAAATPAEAGEPATAQAQPCFDAAQFLGDAAHSGAGMATTGIDGAPQVLWTSPTVGVMAGAPAIVAGVAYIADGLLGHGALRAIDTATGADLWTAPLPGQTFGSTPAVVDGVAYIGDVDGNMSAIDLETHEPVWTVQLAGSISASPAVADGIVVINVDDTVYALDPATGDTRWSFGNGGDGGYTVESSAAVVDGVVFTTSIASDGDESLWALDAATGKELWSYRAGAAGLTTPTYHNGVVYAGGEGGLVAVDAITGDEVWSSEIGHVFSAPSVADDLVVVHTRSDLVAVDAATGELAWRANTGGSWSAPTIVDGVVYVGSNGVAAQLSVQLVDATTGELITRIEGFGSVSAPVVVTGGVAFAATDDGLIAVGDPVRASCSADAD